jgi:hypothetical protein
MTTSTPIATRQRNWLPWGGFVLALIGFLSYLFVFYRFPVTRDVPWVSFLLFAAGLACVVLGLRRAYARPPAYRGRVSAPILALLSVAIVAFFCYGVFAGSRDLPASSGAPKVGQKAPDLTLSDSTGHPVSLAALLSEPFGVAAHPPRGVLLVFYRGYW